MSDTVIKVENLSKQYRTGNRDAGYKTSRETLVDAAIAPFQRFSNLFNRKSQFTNRNLSSSMLSALSSMPYAPGSMKSSLSDEFGRRNCIALVNKYTVKALASQERNAQKHERPPKDS